MPKIMLINTVEGQECRIAVVDGDGGLEELYVERASSASHVGNIYKGRVTNVESAIQAAFVQAGLPVFHSLREGAKAVSRTLAWSRASDLFVSHERS